LVNLKFSTMESIPKDKLTDLTADEIETVMKALGHYQIQIFDELSRNESNREELEAQSKRASSSIKKLHKLHDSLTGASH
jgi:hypothetical protein